MRNWEILSFLKKHKIFLHANALWQYNKKLGASTIIWPNDSARIRIWHNKKDKIVKKY